MDSEGRMVGFLTGRLELHLRRRFNFVSIRMCLGEKKKRQKVLEIVCLAWICVSPRARSRRSYCIRRINVEVAVRAENS